MIFSHGGWRRSRRVLGEVGCETTRHRRAALPVQRAIWNDGVAVGIVRGIDERFAVLLFVKVHAHFPTGGSPHSINIVSLCIMARLEIRFPDLRPAACRLPE